MTAQTSGASTAFSRYFSNFATNAGGGGVGVDATWADFTWNPLFYILKFHSQIQSLGFKSQSSLTHFTTAFSPEYEASKASNSSQLLLLLNLSFLPKFSIMLTSHWDSVASRLLSTTFSSSLYKSYTLQVLLCNSAAHHVLS